jgi:hypothetical protein
MRIQNLESRMAEQNTHLSSLVLQASRQSYYDSTHHSVLGILHKNANYRSASYIESFIGSALFFFSREELWDFTLQNLEVEGLLLEFGVSDGYSINYFASKVDQTIYGFDGFQGLPENWPGASLQMGHFNRNGSPPEVESNVNLVAGDFALTLDNFILENSTPIRMVHIDSDLFSSCELILDKLSKQLVQGTVIIFDEYFGFPGWEFGEFLAFKNFTASNNRNYVYLGCSQNQVAIKFL